MVAFSEDNRAFVFLSSIVCREAAFDFKSGTIDVLILFWLPTLCKWLPKKGVTVVHTLLLGMKGCKSRKFEKVENKTLTVLTCGGAMFELFFCNQSDRTF